MTPLFYSLVLTALGICLFTSAVAIELGDDALAQNPLVLNSTNPEILRQLRALRQDVQNRGCNVNVCFAIQGDAFITPIEFFDQINFLDLIANILTTDESGGLCAVQYGRTTTPISSLTDRRPVFAERLDLTTQVGGNHSNMASALGYAAFQLRTRREDANKIVLFADGFQSVGMSPRRIAKQIQQEGIQICAVGVGAYSVPELQNIVGSSHRVLTINGYFELLEIVNALVYDICGI